MKNGIRKDNERKARSFKDMKTRMVLAMVCLAMQFTLFAQGTMVFKARLTYDQQYRGKPTPLVGSALLTLQENGFVWANADIDFATENTGALLAQATSIDQPSFWVWPLFPLASYTHNTPNGPVSGWSYSSGRVFPDSDLDDLKSGKWWVDVVSPNGSIRGQLVAVPEPSTWALLSGTVLFWGLMAARKSQACGRSAGGRGR